MNFEDGNQFEEKIKSLNNMVEESTNSVEVGHHIIKEEIKEEEKFFDDFTSMGGSDDSESESEVEQPKLMP